MSTENSTNENIIQKKGKHNKIYHKWLIQMLSTSYNLQNVLIHVTKIIK